MSLGKKFKSKSIQKSILLYALVFISIFLVSVLIFLPYVPLQINYNIGDVVDKTIKAPKTITFQSKSDIAKTQKIKYQRALNVEKIYTIDKDINKNVVRNIIKFFNDLKIYRQDLKEKKYVEVPFNIKDLSINSIKYARLISDNDLIELEYLTVQNAELLLNEGIQFIDKFTIDNRLSDKLKILNLSDEKMDFILDVLIRFLQTNYVYDQKATKEKIDKALQEVESITTSIKKNQILIQKNDVFTVENQELLTELGIYGLRFDYFKFLGLFVINILLFFLLERFVYYFNFRIYSNKKVLRINILCLISCNNFSVYFDKG